jgi:hypothetical protein
MMRARTTYVIMCGSLDHDYEALLQRELVGEEHAAVLWPTVEKRFLNKGDALNRLAELTAKYPKTVYTLYELVPTQHTTHKR